jgi:hypothetical protein
MFGVYFHINVGRVALNEFIIDTDRDTALVLITPENSVPTSDKKQHHAKTNT